MIDAPAGNGLLTVDEADRLYPNDNIEVHRGEVLMMPAPSSRHQALVEKILEEFKAWFRGKPCKPMFGREVRLSEHIRYIPDAVVLCDRSKLTEAGIEGAPDLVVEVKSPSTGDFDTGEKRLEYLKAGVREYWVLDPVKAIGIRWVNGETDVEMVANQMESSIFQGLALDLRVGLWEE